MSKPVRFLHAEIKTPPMSETARVETGRLLRLLQEGKTIAPPQSELIREIGRRVHELRVNDLHETWRVIYRVDPDAIVIAEVFSRKTRSLPQHIIKACAKRYREYGSR